MEIDINILLIVVTFIVVIFIIISADSLTSAVLIVSLLANFLAISSRFGKMAKKKIVVGGSGSSELFENSAEIGTEINNIDEDAFPEYKSIYDDNYDKWSRYKTSYTDCYDDVRPVAVSCGELDSGIDGRNAILAQQRARDKKCIDGWASKDANYFRQHYGSELDDEEAKPWWSRGEY